MKPKLNWDIESIFPGGSDSKEYATYLEKLQIDIAAGYNVVQNKPSFTPTEWVQLLDEVQDLAKRLRHASAFVGCLTAQNSKDAKATLLRGQVTSLGAA
ncbi:MAG TPA: oligoendopeptidase, partial [Bacillota bacterium]|nr:oligoendopeptidase [Bacillota bacterium]